jgi:predicted XRE-type DNA-binding protein
VCNVEKVMKSRKARKMPQHEVGSGNVYKDLGYPNPDEMLVKAQLASKISEIIGERGYTQSEAATRLGLPQPKLSKLVRGQFRGISERKLMDCLTKLGRDVEIVVSTPARGRKEGSVSVVFV